MALMLLEVEEERLVRGRLVLRVPDGWTEEQAAAWWERTETREGYHEYVLWDEVHIAPPTVRRLEAATGDEALVVDVSE